MSTKNTSSSTGIGFAGALTILFVALKLTHAIGWSWWLVLLPSLIPIVIVAGALLVTVLVVVVKTWRGR